MAKPVALITTFGDDVLPVILAEISAGPQPPVADWFVGTFGSSASTAAKVAAAGCKHAPVFGVQPSTSKQARMHRRLPSADAAKLDPAHEGEIPGSSAGQIFPPGDRKAWGLELGRRFRDELRPALPSIEVWQFDEVLGQCATSLAHREFVGGVLAGLAQGRPELGDGPQKGFVWVARTAMTGLPQLAIDNEVQEFWQDLDRAALFLVGEEYPPFRGDPAAAARTYASAHEALLRGGPIRKSLGQRYVTGMTPGWRVRAGSPPRDLGLGGNLDDKPDAFVSTWRAGFIDARIGTQRPSGYAQFNFVVENAEPDRARSAVQSLHHAAKRHGQ